MTRQELLILLQKHLPQTSGSKAAATKELIALIQTEPDCFKRIAEEGAVHITTSVLLLNHAADRILLMKHKKLKKWLQFGGHADGDDDLHNVARKEVFEECGIANIEFLEPQPLEVARFDYPKEVFGYTKSMLDTRFIAKAPQGATPHKNSESQELRWCTFAEAAALAAQNSDDGLTVLIEKYLASK